MTGQFLLRGCIFISMCHSLLSYWCLAGNGWEWENGMIIDSDYYGSFPHSLLSTSNLFILIHDYSNLYLHCIDTHLVGGWPTPLKNMSSSVGMMTFPIWKSKSHVPNHQLDIHICNIDIILYYKHRHQSSPTHPDHAFPPPLIRQPRATVRTSQLAGQHSLLSPGVHMNWTTQNGD